MNNIQLGTGAVLSPVDYRDGIAQAAVAPTLAAIVLPETFETQLCPEVMMQAQEPDCVSFSVVDKLKLYWFKKTGKWIDFSPRFLAILVKRFDGQDRATGGTFPRLAFKLAVQYGCCTTDLLPNDTTLPTLEYRKESLITEEMLAQASQYRPGGYVSVPLDLVSTRRAIFLYGAISTLFAVGQEMWVPSWNKKDTDPLRTPVKILSGHQMTTKGWTSKTLNKIRNEWSAAWADNGETEYDTTAWAPFIYEQWAFAEIPQNIQDFLAFLPKPTEFHYVWKTDMHQGDNSQDVQFAQIALMILGFLKPINPQDLGIYGPKTAAAVLAYQSAKNITPTAPHSIGPKTRYALNAQFAI